MLNVNTSISSDIDVDGDGNIVNQGLIVADGPGDRSIDVDVFNNEGVIQVANGSILNVLGDWSNTGGTIDIDANSTVQLNNSFNTDDLGDIDNSVGGKVSLRNYNWDNSDRNYTFNNNTGSWEFNGGTVTGGSLTFEDDTQLVIGSGNNVLDDVDVDGNLNLNSANGARLSLTNGSTFTRNANLGENAILSIDSDQTIDNTIIDLDGPGAKFGVSGDGNVIIGANSRVSLLNVNTSISSDIDVDGDGNIINQGTIVADGPGDRSIDVDVFNNEGVIQVANGSILNVLGDWSNTGGTIDIDVNSTVVLQGSFNTVDLGTIDNSEGGQLILQDYDWDNSNSSYTFNNNTGSPTFNGGTITGGTITFGDDTQLVVGNGNNVLDDVDVQGNLNLNSVNGARLSLTNGSTFTGNANLGENAILSIDSDQTINNNIIRLDGADAVFGVSGDSNVILGPNTEVFLSNSNTSISSDIDVDGDGNIINQGLIVADGTVGTPNRSICLDQFTNSGNLEAINGAELHICGSWFNDDGTVTVDGTSAIATDGTYTQLRGTTALSGGTFSAADLVFEGGTLTGFGTISGDLNFNAEIAADLNTGTLAIAGNYTQTDDSILNIELGSTTAFDQLAITGAAVFDGTLQVSFLNGFSAQLGDVFEIATASSISNSLDFTNIDLGNGLELTLVADGDSLSLVTQEKPSEQPTEILGTPNPDILVGTNNNDVIIGKGGGDILTGNGGDDIFKYETFGDAGDIITDFDDGDKIDLSDIMTALGQGGSDGLATGVVGVQPLSTGSSVTIFGIPFIILQNTSVAEVNDSANFIF